MNSIGIRRVRKIGISRSIPDRWSAMFYYLKSGATWYKRETNTVDGYFALHYSSDSGDTWDELLNLDLTEESVIIDLSHTYVHSIVGIVYQVATSGGDVLYSASGSPDYEDLTTYSKTDDNSYLTVEDTKVTVTSAKNKHVAFLVKDFGADYFGTAFEIQFEFRVNSSPNEFYAFCSLLMVTNDDVGGYRDTDDGSVISARLNTGADFDFEVGDRNVAQNHVAHDDDTVYYVTFKRSGATNEYYSYTDAARTVLYWHVARPDGHPTLTYRYLKAVVTAGYDGGSYKEAQITCWIDKIEIISH